MPYQYQGGQHNIFGSGGGPLSGAGTSYLTGGGVGSIGSSLASGGAKDFNEFIAGPFIPPPQGANTTGTSSLQRPFPERIGGNLLNPGGQPSLIGQIGNLPANIAETPVSLIDTATGGGLSDLLKSIGDFGGSNGGPGPIGSLVNIGGEVVHRAFSLPAALMNSQPAMVMSKVYNLPDNTVITPELLQKYGLPPSLAGQFKKNGLPILGWLGITGDQMNVGDLKAELDKRGFLTDAQGNARDWQDIANTVQNDPFGSFQFGDKAVNENGVSDFLLQSLGQVAELAPLGSIAGLAGKAVGLGSKATEGASILAEDLNGVGKIAQLTSKTVKPFGMWARNPAGKLFGGWGDGAVADLAEQGAIKATTVAPSVAAEQIAAGNVAQASLKGAAEYWLKKVLYPSVPGGNALARYYAGQTILRTGLFGVEQLTGELQSHGIDIGPVTALHDFTSAVLNDHPLSDNGLFQAATAFTYPLHLYAGVAIKAIKRPIRSAVGVGAENLSRARDFFVQDFGPDAIKTIGGEARFAAAADRAIQSIAEERFVMPAGLRQSIESVPEATTRLALMGNAVKSVASEMVRTGKITARDIVDRIYEMTANPIGTRIADDGSRTRGFILPYRATLRNPGISPQVALEHFARYLDAEAGMVDPFFGHQTAVLGRASRMTQEDLNMAIQAVHSAASADGTLSAQFVRDLMHQTPGMLDDPFLPAKSHDFAVEAMNPANHRTYTVDEIAGWLQNLKDISPTRDQLWHELSARDAATPVAPGQNGVPGGPMQNGVLRNIHSLDTLKRWRLNADARVRDLTAQRIDLLGKYRAEFSKRGNAKAAAGDLNWQTKAADAMQSTLDVGGGTFDRRTGNPITHKDGYQVAIHPDNGGTFAHVNAGDAVGLSEAAKAIRAEYPTANIGTWTTPDGKMIGVDPSIWVKDRAAAEALGLEKNQYSIWDWKNSTEIKINRPAPLAPAEPPPVFSHEVVQAAAARRDILRQQINDVTNELRTLKSGLSEVRQRAQELRVTTTDFSFYTPDGSPKVHPADAKRLEDMVNYVRENYPQWEVEAGPLLMNKYTPNDSMIQNLMIENSAQGQALFGWGPGTLMSNALEAMFRPVRGSAEAKDAISRFYEVMMKLGAKQNEVDNFLKYTNEVMQDERTFGIGGEQIPLTRGFQAVGATTLSRQAIKAFDVNPAFKEAFHKRFGGRDFSQMFVPVAEAYNPAVRAIQRKIEAGKSTGRLQRLFASGYDRYHIGATKGMASATRTLAKFVYPLLRFALNPLYHAYNLTEADIIGLTMDGSRVWRGAQDAALSRDVFNTVERGNPEAMASLREAQRRARALGRGDLTPQAPTGGADLRQATIDNTGVTFGLNTRRATIIERQLDARRPQTIIDTLKSFAADDPAMVAFMRRYGINPDKWVEDLSHDMYQIDMLGAKKYINGAAQKQGWGIDELKAMEPITSQIAIKMQQAFDDLYSMHVGNVNRTRLERLLNSYWLYWPVSYMLKANKWMFDVLTNRAFGHQTNLGGAWTLTKLADEYHQRYQNDPNFKKLVDDNKDLEFMLSSILPVAPWSDGVSLNRMTRQVGGWLGLWPDYSNFDIWNIKNWAGKMSDIGPLYSIPLMADVASNLGKDFGIQFGGKGGQPNKHQQVIPSIVKGAQSLFGINGAEQITNVKPIPLNGL